MDFLVGRSAGVTDPADVAATPKNQLEARVLAIRPARRGQRQGTRTERRRKKGRQRDPQTGRVLLLLVPNAADLPPDLADGKYRVFLRFKKA